MRALCSFLYGVAAYLACLAAQLYLIGFSGNLLVPKSVDVGSGAPWVEALGTDLLLLALFGVQHSVMARRGFKRWWTRVVPPVVERSTYVVATCAVLALMFWFWVPIEAPVVWQVKTAPAWRCCGACSGSAGCWRWSAPFSSTTSSSSGCSRSSHA